MHIVFIFAAFELFSVVYGKENRERPSFYDKCNIGVDGMINIHIVPHSHHDLGWVKTVDEYYNDGTRFSVVNILNSAINELANDPKRRFVYAEIGFFSRWWSEQDDKIREEVRNLVKEGRLEFVIGGWAMNDEATTYYTDIIDQQTLGLQFILKEFGHLARPRVAWQIDPFGHSREQASLFAQFGFDGLFHGRIDYQDFEYRGKQLTREMIWKASTNLGDNANIFTGILPNGYDSPYGFCFDESCVTTEPLDDTSWSIDYKIDLFINYVLLAQSKLYKTNNLIMTMGGDFQYTNATRYFVNLDRLIHYVNERQLNGSKINVFYSTPSCYLYSLYRANVTWPTKDDDFFPYAHQEHSFWTGYYTSRPTLKEYVRRSSNFLQIVRQLSAFARMTDESTQYALDTLTDAMGILQHHDAVSGTEKQYVANDYSRRLSFGTQNCIEVIEKSLTNIALSNSVKGEHIRSDNYKLKLHHCPLNISECLPIEDKENFTVIVYNPLGRVVQSWIRIPVTNKNYKIYDLKTFDLIDSEICEIYTETKMLSNRKSSAEYEILFNADLPPMGFNTYIVQSGNIKTHNSHPILPIITNMKRNSNELILKNSHLTVYFDTTGNIAKIERENIGISTNVKQNICYYNSMAAKIFMIPEHQPSGAYIFRPNGTENCFSVKKYTFKYGKEYNEVHQVYNEWISQTIRLYDNAEYVEFEWQVGPIDVDDDVGKEVITKFNTDINSGSVFYTDSNGREILKRVRDYRPSWPNFTQTEPISGNYYPVDTRIYIRDASNTLPRQLTIVNDRSQGGSSLKSGSIELMIHRRVLQDDSLGLMEPLNETDDNGKGLIAKGKHYVFFDTVFNSAILHRDMAHQVNNRPLVMFGVPRSNVDYKIMANLRDWRALKNALPNNVHILTLMHDFSNKEDDAIIIRLEHFYEKDEDFEYSLPVTINLIDLLSPVFDITDIEELALGTNMEVTELNNRLVFNGINNIYPKVPLTASSFITLNPMEIRTFRLRYKKKSLNTWNM